MAGPAYTPIVAPPLTGNPELTQLQQWVASELDRIGQRFTNSDVIQYNVAFSAPEKPREGMTVVADGTHWNPGGGPGKYTYIGGVWVKQVSKADTDALYLTAAQADVLFLTQTEGDARYVLLSTPPAAAVAFSAHKNSVDQSVATGSGSVTITWPNTLFDVGSHFGSNVWTPPAGKVALSVGLLVQPPQPPTYSFSGANLQAMSITKNGGTFKSVFTYEQGNSNGTAFYITINDVANGTDNYGVSVNFNTTGSPMIVTGFAERTWFMGHWIGP